tara:strand:+ start:2007 stop:2723 length:717 start_codon:yes stop_codon:yes gene_type:complete
MNRAKLDAIARSSGWLALQPELFQDAVLGKASVVSFAARAYVFHTGDEPGGVYGVLSGGFGIYIAGRDSSVSLGHVLRAGRWFGYGPALTRVSRTLTFRTMEPSAAFFLPLAALDEIGSRNTDFMRRVCTMLAVAVDEAIATTVDLLIRRSDMRIAAILLRVTGVEDGIGPSEPEGYILTQTELAEMANVSRDVVNRTLARFKAQGWVALTYNRIAVRDPAALSGFASGNTAANKNGS